ncbi:GNAT family N-acetyltransferase [Clostridium sp. LP20]|uniref:GNAT family N-acetyltransferase n=1 Tax=Clostridium sp. LP20 TaxID=3418665 RepID=UPI003EE71D08
MIYKNLTKEYIKDVSELFIKAFNAEPWNDKWTMETASKRLLQMMNCDGFDGLVAFEEDKLVGMILGNHEYYYSGMQFVIKEFCIDTSLRGTGKGKKLIEDFEERLRGKGIDEVILMTSRADETQGFYSKRGYKEISSLVMMMKEL